MFSSKVVFAVVASVALASAAPGLLDSLPIVGGGDGGVGGVIGGGQGGSGGLLGGLLGDGSTGGLLGGLLGGNGIGELLDGVLAGGPLGDLLGDLLDDLLTLVQNLLQNLQEVLNNLPQVLESLTGILGQDLPLPEQAKAIEALRQQNPVELDTIFFMAQNLAKQQGGNGGVAPQLPVPSTQEAQNRIRIRP